MVNEKPTTRSTRLNSASSELGHMYDILNDLKLKLESCYEIIQDQNRKIDNLQKEIKYLRDSKEQPISSQTGNKSQKTYADVAKKQDHVLIVKPKDDRNAKTITNELKQNINPTDLQIGLNIGKTVKNGGVLIKCSKAGDLSTVKSNIELKLGDNYEVQEPKKRTPKIIIMGVREEETNIELAEMIQNIILQNRIEQGENFKFEPVFSTKCRDGKFNLVLEVDAATFKVLMKCEYPELYIGWNTHKIFEYYGVKRCYNCWGFNHEAKLCKERSSYCMLCAGNHKSANCKSDVRKCINCIRANNKLNLNLDILHSATDRNCKCYQRIVDSIKKKTDYNGSGNK